MNRSLRVCCIEPAGNASKVFSDSMRLPLMGFLYLGTILDAAGHRVEILNESILGHQVDPFTLDADVFCITALTVSSIRARELAIALKNIHPDAKIIIGGVHASLNTPFFEDIADHIVIGEAESIIVGLVEGTITDRIVRGSPVEDLNALPLINYNLIRGRNRMSVIPIMTSRGCPFDCSFCSVTMMFGRHFRSMSSDRILQEIVHALPFFPGHTIFFYDDNFTADRDRIESLCRLIIDQNIVIRWGVQLRSEVSLYPDLIALMADAGCDRVFIGFESINNEVLKALHKSQSSDDVKRAIVQFQRYGIQVHGMFMFGEDHDTVESIRATAEFAVDMQIDTVQFMILTPFPGTRLYTQLQEQKRVLHTIWNYFDGMFAVFHPALIGSSTLQRETIRAYEQFYALHRTLADAVSMVFQMIVDAMMLNSRSSRMYHIESLLFRFGAWFLIRRFKQISKQYIHYLERVDAAEAERSERP